MGLTQVIMWITLIAILPVMAHHAEKTGHQVDGSRNHYIVTSLNNNVSGIDFVSAYASEDPHNDIVEISSVSNMDSARVSTPTRNILTVVTPTTSDADESLLRGAGVATEILSTQAISVSNADTPIDTTVDVDADNNVMWDFADANIHAEQDNHNRVENLMTRERRSLTYPDPSTLLLIFGLGTPLQLDSESVIVGVFTKMIYTLPTNSTDFTEPGVYFARTKSRWSIYKVLERAVELYGFGAGKGCLLRAICEVAAAPFDLRHGLFGQMAQAFLSPSSTSEAYDEYRDREYHAAERLGRHVGQNCHALYPECQRNVLDIFSTTATTPATTTTTTTTKANLI